MLMLNRVSIQHVGGTRVPIVAMPILCSDYTSCALPTLRIVPTMKKDAVWRTIATYCAARSLLDAATAATFSLSRRWWQGTTTTAVFLPTSPCWTPHSLPSATHQLHWHLHGRPHTVWMMRHVSIPLHVQIVHINISF